MKLKPKGNTVKGFLNRFEGAFPERYEVGEIMLAACLVGQHVLLVGDPGIAKSEMAMAVLRAVDPGEEDTFALQMTIKTSVEHVFGNLDMKLWRSGVTCHNVAGYLPTKRWAHLDELFDANPLILRSLNGVIHPRHRKFMNGPQQVDCPLQTLIATTNYMPDRSDPVAFKLSQGFVDRFALTMHVAPPAGLEVEANLIAGVGGESFEYGLGEDFFNTPVPELPLDMGRRLAQARRNIAAKLETKTISVRRMWSVGRVLCGLAALRGIEPTNELLRYVPKMLCYSTKDYPAFMAALGMKA